LRVTLTCTGDQSEGAATINVFAAAFLSADRAPITIELSDDYSKTFNIRLNGQFVGNEAVLQQLSDKITDPHKPVIVLMPGQVTFNGWDEIRGLLKDRVLGRTILCFL